jgi:hypothetical protein
MLNRMATLAAAALAAVSTSALAGAWEYRQDSRASDGSAIRVASLASEPVPGRGPRDATAARIEIRANADHAPRVLLRLDAGDSVLCGYGQQCAVMVRFDGARWQQFPATRPDDDDASTLALDDASRFVEHARSARRIDVSFTAPQAGTRFAEFTARDPLAWDAASVR